MISEQPNNYFDETYELLKQYTDDRLLLVKIQTAKKTAKITSKLIYIFISAILLFFTLLFLGFMLAYYFAEIMHSNFYGFSTVAGIFIFLFLLFMVLYKHYFSHKVKNMVTRIFFENDINPLNEADDEDE